MNSHDVENLASVDAGTSNSLDSLPKQAPLGPINTLPRAVLDFNPARILTEGDSIEHTCLLLAFQVPTVLSAFYPGMSRTLHIVKCRMLMSGGRHPQPCANQQGELTLWPSGLRCKQSDGKIVIILLGIHHVHGRIRSGLLHCTRNSRGLCPPPLNDQLSERSVFVCIVFVLTLVLKCERAKRSEGR